MTPAGAFFECEIDGTDCRDAGGTHDIEHAQR